MPTITEERRRPANTTGVTRRTRPARTAITEQDAASLAGCPRPGRRVSTVTEQRPAEDLIERRIDRVLELLQPARRSSGTPATTRQRTQAEVTKDLIHTNTRTMQNLGQTATQIATQDDVQAVTQATHGRGQTQIQTTHDLVQANTETTTTQNRTQPREKPKRPSPSTKQPRQTSKRIGTATKQTSQPAKRVTPSPTTKQATQNRNRRSTPRTTTEQTTEQRSRRDRRRARDAGCVECAGQGLLRIGGLGGQIRSRATVQ
jgi:hypothetical protein